MSLEPIDLLHGGNERTIAADVVDTDGGPALFDCGPTSTVDALKAGLGAHGLAPTEVRHLLLSHVHLDHAGAAGVLVREHPELQVHVSGRRGISSPGAARAERAPAVRRLVRHPLGRARAGSEGNVHIVGNRVLGLDCFPHRTRLAPCPVPRPRRHAYAGDAAGVRIQPGRFVLPPTPPPEFDLDTWQQTLEEIELRDPERLALIHWGVADDPQRHLAELRLELYDWADYVRGGADVDEFTEYVRAELRDAGEDPGQYDLAMPLWQSYQGLKRWADRNARA